MNTPPSVQVSAKRLDGPLRVRSLEARLHGRPDGTALLQRAAELDQRVQETFRRILQPTTPRDERLQAVDELAAARREFDAFLATVGEEGCGGARFADLDPTVRAQLALVLGVADAPEFLPLLEVKAAEYVEQGRAFDSIAAEFGFVDAPSLGVLEARGALVLTQSGSLFQISAPGADGNARLRRFVYDNLYGSALPATGTLRLREPICVGARMSTSKVLTSVVRKLRVPVRAEPWPEQHANFERMRNTIRDSQARCAATIWGAKPNWVPSVHVRSVDVARNASGVRPVAALEHEARAELRSLVLRLADPFEPPRQPVLEASIVGLCIHLQELHADCGAKAASLGAVTVFETDRGERCARTGSGLRLERPSRAPVEYAGASLGVQHVVVGAPIALVDAQGSIVAVLGDVTRIEP